LPRNRIIHNRSFYRASDYSFTNTDIVIFCRNTSYINAVCRLVFSPAFGLIRLPCPSVRLVDNSRTERVSGFTFGMWTNYTK
jgi:hypothetical protein